jgi:peptide/nickel transport system substrate-binding protein
VTHWTPRTTASPTPGDWRARVVCARIVLSGIALAAFALMVPRVVPAQSASPRTSFVVATGAEATVPVPTLMEKSHGSTENSDVADQVFARLGQLGPTLITSGDRAFEPLLARSWTRRDSVTLAFDLDPRATWHDGVPVTAADVVFTFNRARNPAVSPGLANLLRRIASVTAEGERRVVFRYTEPYAEQLYDAVFHLAPLPAHLLASIPADSLENAPFVQAPVGSGPYRWVRHVPGEFVELAANDRFFLGAPAVRRVIFRTAADGDARLNMLLAGEADATENIPAPRSNIDRVAADKNLRIIAVPSPTLGFLLFNQRDPRDRNRPHPILSERDVRRAIGLALDRRLMVQAVLGTAGEVPYGPASTILWIRHGTPAPAPIDLRQARRLLGSLGWTDHDGDGMRDREGQPLALTLIVPTTSPNRKQIAQMVQEQLRALGVQIKVDLLDFSVYTERRNTGAFDIDFSSTSQDPSPSGLAQGWSCQGRTNVARYCDPVVDSLIDTAVRTSEGAGPAWHAVLRRIEDDAPAVFIYVQSYMYAVNRRFTNVRIRPESAWLGLREWTVGPQGARRPVGY